jgi:hypothetical protein
MFELTVFLVQSLAIFFSGMFFAQNAEKRARQERRIKQEAKDKYWPL